ncbi:uncharacterized protein LOC122756470 [Drosophila santomea]|uniref:uncharacterized protein LOC122756470 n=1 Tax=Drosophila santomea TaxID=129105 RepID=UPI001CCF8C72|nr:uncharacterized protein LOC122756470 [Drosophila santomea]
MHLQKMTVWRGFSDGGVIGPYFFESDNGVAVPPKDAATCHTAHSTMDVLQEQLPDMVPWNFSCGVCLSRRSMPTRCPQCQYTPHHRSNTARSAHSHRKLHKPKPWRSFE